MARNNDRERTKRISANTRPPGRARSCSFCQEGATWVDYKDSALLRRFLSDRGKIRARRVTGNCAQHQRDVAIAIKTARELALMPYAQRTVSERGVARAGRGGPARRDGGPDTTAATADSDQIEDLDLDDAHELEEVDA